ncbi:MAG TPA: hypothetical protein VLC51_04175, partial [Nitrospira sp.]|nr:hypothetical protein [Nitrospira sp.]
MLLDAILVAGILYVCPGDVYSDQPRPGCRPMQETNKEGFSKIPEAPEFNSNSPAPGAVDAGAASRDGQTRLPAASAEECARYEEWVRLSTKSSSIGARDLSAGE